MKTCPRCAEQVQNSASVCRYCSYKFSSFTRANDALNNLGCGGLVIIAIFVVIIASAFPGDQHSQTTPALSAETVTACDNLIEKAGRDGLIRERPTASTAQVDELMWAELPADSKKGLAMALRCSAFNGAAGELDGAEIDGFRTGKRLALATSVGVSLG